MNNEELLIAFKAILDTALDAKLEPVHAKLGQLDAKIDDVERRLSGEIGTIKTQLEALKAEVKEGDRLTLEAAKDVSRDVKAINRKFDLLTSDLFDLRARQKDVEERFEQIEKFLAKQ